MIYGGKNSFAIRAFAASVFASAIFGVASASAYTITYNANGALFDNGQETNEVVYDNNHNVTSGEEKNPYMNSPVTYELFWSTDTVGKKRVDLSSITSDTTLYAQYKNVVWNFGYTGGEQTFTLPYSKYVRYELWGAEGGKTDSALVGGYGGYARGFASLNINTVVNIVNGEAGSTEDRYTYNGGGRTGANASAPTGSGGGATHVAFGSGVLADFVDHKDDVLIVAGAGGGSTANNTGLKTGGSGGGFQGGLGAGTRFGGRGGTQTAGGKLGNVGALVDNRYGGFGLGGNSEAPTTSFRGGGGGAGWYGGAGGGFAGDAASNGGGGGGSGYVASVNIVDGVMYGYKNEIDDPAHGFSVPTNDEEGTRTYQTENYASQAITGYAKQGDGYTTLSIIMPTITYKWGDNEESMNIVYREKATLTDIDPSRTARSHYDMIWQLNGVDYDFDTPVTEDIVLVAKYTPIVYNLSCNLNGGTVTTPNPTTYTVESASITLNNPIAPDYYTFKGWSGTDLTSDANTSVTIPTGSYGDREYVANYTPILYIINYDLDGGTNNANNPDTYTYESADITLADPTKEGYSFKGWIKNEGDTPGGITISHNSHGDKSYKAVFEINEYTATFDANSGTTANPETITKNYDVVLGELPTTSRTGYKFDGWFTGQNDGDQISADTKMPATNPTYYAHWTPIQYTFHFNANTGEGSMADEVYDYDETKPLTAFAFTKLGFTFTGWDTEVNGGGDTYTDGQDIHNLTTEDGKEYTLYAQWSRDTYTIDYDFNDGETDTDATLITSYNVESDDIVLPTPTRKGYKFLGWSGTDITDKAENVTIPTGSTGNRSYAASWEIIEYRITYDMDGHINASTNPGGYTVTSPDIALATPTAKDDYYYFVGWALDRDTEDGLTKDFIIPTGSTGDITIYAIFQQNPYTVTFDSDGAGDYPERVLRGDAMIGELPIPEKSGYEFLGWFVEGEKIDENFHSRYDVTAVAQWEEIIVVPDTGANNSSSMSGVVESYMVTIAACCLIVFFVTSKHYSKDEY